MIHSLYDYYSKSALTLEEILSEFVDNYYLKKYSDDKAAKVIKKAIEADEMKTLNGQSIKDSDFEDCYPKYEDFVNAIKKSLWFALQSDRTVVLAVLAAAADWNRRTNFYFCIVDEETFRNNIILVFQKYQIMENISNNQVPSMKDGLSLHDFYVAEKEKKAKEFINGIQWFVYKTIINLVAECNMKITDNYVKDHLKIVINAAEGAGDIKRIARNLGIKWDEIIDKEIKEVLLFREHSYYTLKGPYGDSVDIIKFLEGFNHTLHSRL